MHLNLFVDAPGFNNKKNNSSHKTRKQKLLTLTQKYKQQFD